MGKMPDRFPQIWKLRNDDGSFTHLFTEQNTSVYNQAYRGRTVRSGGNLYVCYKIFNRNGKRFGYVVPADSESAKTITRIKAAVTWDNGKESYIWCEPDKYILGKTCECEGLFGTHTFTFGEVLERTTVYDWCKTPAADELGGVASCTI